MLCLPTLPSNVFTISGKLLMRLQHLEHHLSPYRHCLQLSRIEEELKICHHGEDGTCVPKLRNLLPNEESCWVSLHYSLGAKLLPCQLHFLSKACVCATVKQRDEKNKSKPWNYNEISDFHIGLDRNCTWFKMKWNGWMERLAQTAIFVSSPSMSHHFQVWPFYFEYYSNYSFPVSPSS